ncbi:MAG: lipopolysaccharide heptosyltransferase II [Bacteroidota bacterium]
MKSCLVIQTAFIGDAVLTLPLVQVLKKADVDASVDVLAIPRTSELFSTHPAIHHVHIIDKRGKDSGLAGLRRFAHLIAEAKYDVALIPHRSIRSAVLPWLGRIHSRIGFDRSAGWFLMTQTVRYDPSVHEVERNLSLLRPLGIQWAGKELPNLFPTLADVQAVDAFLENSGLPNSSALIGIAPGSVWQTKRWPKESFAEITKTLSLEGFSSVLIGGKEDEQLCREIKGGIASDRVAISAGRLSVIQSAELIRRCRALVSNDSAPMHLAVAMRTPVLAIFGSTVPEFGFSPFGNHSAILEAKGLPCRPCSVHGSQRCPIKTFDCMVNISASAVFNKVREMVA